MTLIFAASRKDLKTQRRGVFFKAFATNRGAVVGLCILIALVFVALFAPLLAPHSPIEQFRDRILQPPGWTVGGSWGFPFGTDDLGRDIMSRLIYGARLSMTIGATVVLVSLVLGTSLGLIAATGGTAIDGLVMRLMDIMLVFPGLLLALVIVAILGPDLINAVIAVSLVTLPSYARLVRAAALAELSKDYVAATRGAGAGRLYIMLNTVLPNCMPPLIVQASLGFSGAILDAAGLGFLGLGAQPPTPEWGTMLAGALQYYQSAWWVLVFPGVSILTTVLSFNLVGDGLRDALDPKLRR
jgi:dipeptide transport system permease protein